ncbi:Archaemetzincin-2, partial [Acipenser ruthenus]
VLSVTDAETLRAALVSKRQDLVESYQKYSPGERRLLEEGFHPDSVLFGPITLHSESDWIHSHPEPRQDFADFYRNPYRSTPVKGRNTIYIQTIGSFGDSEESTQLYVEWLQEYCEAFYYGLAVRLLEPVPVSDTACAFRVNTNSHNLQIHAGMGIFSFARYDDNFYSRNYKGRLQKTKKLTPGDYSLFSGCYTPPITSTLLYRSCKTLTHEIGHIFGLKHCQWLRCVMQGSNHLEESDRRPLDLCPICVRKLQSAIGFRIAERYQALLRWIESGLSSVTSKDKLETETKPHKPTRAFEESREWLLKCLSVLEDVLI